MRLIDLIGENAYRAARQAGGIPPDLDGGPEITALTADSRTVRPGALFAALFVASAVASVVSRQITRNFGSLRACTDRIRSGDLTAAVDLEGGRVSEPRRAVVSGDGQPPHRILQLPNVAGPTVTR